MDSRLSVLQRELLEAFFRQEQGFFLTRGAALAGFLTGHRTTADLDLFTESQRLDEGERALAGAARDLGADVESLRTSPDFRRRIVRRRDDAVVVDLVRERVPQGYPKKLEIGGIRVDPPGEILANKLCALLARAEIRDLVDVLVLERAGNSLDDALALARRKDGGLTPGQLAWVLSEIQIGDDARVPGNVAPSDLRGYLHDLVATLSRRAHP